MTPPEVTIIAQEQDFPGSLVDLRVMAWPVQAVSEPANLYLNASVVSKADFGELGFDSDWQDVLVALPIRLFESGDVLVDLCPAFLVGGIERQETGFLGGSDNWGLAVDQAPGPPPRVLPPLAGIDAWWQDTKDDTVLMLTFRIRNLGQCQLPNVCLSIDALVYRPSVHGLE